MTGLEAGWGPTFVVGLVMVAIAPRMGLLTPPGQRTRCGACGRFLVRPGARCPCTRRRDG